MPAARRRQLVEGYLARSAERRELLAKLERLTQREREVLALLADGQRAQAVADHFVVSLATVRTQIRAVLTKLEVGSQLEAVALYPENHRALSTTRSRRRVSSRSLCASTSITPLRRDSRAGGVPEGQSRVGFRRATHRTDVRDTRMGSAAAR